MFRYARGTRFYDALIIDNANADDTLARLMELVLDAVREDS